MPVIRSGIASRLWTLSWFWFEPRHFGGFARASWEMERDLSPSRTPVPRWRVRLLCSAVRDDWGFEHIYLENTVVRTHQSKTCAPHQAVEASALHRSRSVTGKRHIIAPQTHPATKCAQSQLAIDVPAAIESPRGIAAGTSVLSLRVFNRTE